MVLKKMLKNMILKNKIKTKILRKIIKQHLCHQHDIKSREFKKNHTRYCDEYQMKICKTL